MIKTEELDIYLDKVNNNFGEFLYVPYKLKSCDAQRYFEGFDYIKKFLQDNEYVCLDESQDEYFLHYRNGQYGVLEFYLTILKEDNKLSVSLGHSCSVGYASAGYFECKIEDFISEYYKYRKINEERKL